ncbi:MAG: VWA domain-containing protein [Planctomycetota bacterium]
MLPDPSSMPKSTPPPIPKERRLNADERVSDQPPPICDVSPSTALFSLETDTQGRDGLDRQRTRAWWGSLALHGALILLFALLLAPAQLGTAAIQTLVVRFSTDTPVEPPPVLIQSSDTQESSLKVETVEVPEPVEVPVQPVVEVSLASSRTPGGTQSSDGRSNGESSSGSRGSFFGLEATGQRFVYVVDRSGSMSGSRYQRAVTELKRSIDGLTEDQKFLVIMFSSGKKVMFDMPATRTQLVPATDENKSKFKEWLSGVSVSGGTRPNAALRLAMKQSPEAMFMLSDGEFNKESFNVKSSFLGGGGDPFQIVSANGGDIPVHAIAFEDPRSCENMKKMAALTGGDYRFVSAGELSADVIKEAEAVLGSVDLADRPLELRRVLQKLSPLINDKKKVQSYADSILKSFETQRSRDLSPAEMLESRMQELDALASLNPSLEYIRDRYDEQVESMLESFNQLKATGDIELETIVKLVETLHHSPDKRVLAEPLISEHWGPDTDLDKVSADLKALQKLTNQQWSLGAVMIQKQLYAQYQARLLAHFNRYRERGEHAKAIASVLTQWDAADSMVKPALQKTLQQYTFSVLAEIREKARSRERGEATRIKEALTVGFQSKPIMLSQFRRQFATLERTASVVLRRADRMPVGEERTEVLNRILTLYAHTRSADKAERLIEQDKLGSSMDEMTGVATH